MSAWGSYLYLQQFAKEQLGFEVIWARQDAPRPPRPYATISIVSDVQQEHASLSALNQDEEATVITHDQVTVSFSVYSETTQHPFDAMDRLKSLRQSFMMPSKLFELGEKGWAFVRILLGPNDVSELVDSRWQPRAVMDVEFRIARSVLDFLGSVEQVGISGEISGLPVMDEIITKP